MDVGTESKSRSGRVVRERRWVCIKLLVLFLSSTLLFVVPRVEGYWCVARSDASDKALLSALDYACGEGADCAPLQPDGLCYLPNTLQAHASYAFNSFYQRKNMGPGSCDFAGTATLAKTDPSYGSCVYPPNPSTAGAGTSATTSSSNNTTSNPYGTAPPTTPTGSGSGNSYGLTPNFGPPNYNIPTTTSGSTSSLLRLPIATAAVAFLLGAFCFITPLIASF